MARIVNRTGVIFGRWTVISRIGTDSKKRATWLCRCECGTEKVFSSTYIQTGRSFGCAVCSGKRQARLGTARAAVLHGYTYNARKRSLSWELSAAEFDVLTSSDCWYCGCPPANIQRTRRTYRACSEFRYNGIDRLENNVGYVFGNVVPCCGTCNHAKCTMPYSQFVEWINRVYKHINKI